MRKYAALIQLFFLIIFAVGCASKFNLQTESFEQRRHALTKEIRSAQQVTDFKGSGSITVVEDGRRNSGKCSDGIFCSLAS